MAAWAAIGTAQTRARTEGAGVFVGLSLAHAGVLLAAPSIPVIAIGLWWSANTVAHNFIHRPFFRDALLNRAYSLYLSVLLGLPQRLWRDRHLAHHAGRPARIRWSAQLAVEISLVIALWATLVWLAPAFLVAVYLPGWIIGLVLCQVHGHYEHARGTTSHYGRVYNLFFFNDGYHVEHHRRPHADWRALASGARADERPSRWPPVLRWLETIEGPRASLAAATRSVLGTLERIVLRSARLQRFVIDIHERAFRRVWPVLPDGARITVVGGGLFPRTALVLRRIAPAASLTIVDESRPHMASAAAFLDDERIELVTARFDPARAVDADLVVIPLAFEGNRRLVYDRPPARRVLVHDWIWSRRGRSVAISWLLLKRLNLVER